MCRKLLLSIAIIAILGFYPQNPGFMEPPWVPSYPHVIMTGPDCCYILAEPNGTILKEDLDEPTVSEPSRGTVRY